MKTPGWTLWAASALGAFVVLILGTALVAVCVTFAWAISTHRGVLWFGAAFAVLTLLFRVFIGWQTKNDAKE